MNLGAPVLLTAQAKDHPDQVASVVEVCLAELDSAHTAAVANRCELSAIPAVTDAPVQAPPRQL